MEQEAFERSIKQILELYILPEIGRRQEKGTLPVPASFIAAQVVFYSDDRKPEILLDGEVKAKFLCKAKPGLSMEVGKNYGMKDIELFEELRLTEDFDCNAGHITIVRHNQYWFMSFDLRYDKELSRKTIETAQQFIEASEFSIQRGNLSAAIDTLFSASELIAKAILLGMPDPKFRRKATHYAIKMKLNQFAKLENVSHDYSEVLNKLAELRDNARYLKGEVKITPEKVNDYLATIKRMQQEAKQRIAPLKTPLLDNDNTIKPL